MDDYIRKDEAINLLEHNDKVFHYADRDKENIVNDTINTLCRVLIEMKSEDVQPVKRGRWLGHHAIWIDQPKIEGWFVQAKCSECEKWAHVMNPYTKSVDYECCPHCGVRMDGDTND